MSNATLISKQKAIYAGLKPLLNEQQLMEAMLVWQDKYAQDAGFSARYFSNDVAALTHNKVTSKKILISVIAELTGKKNHTEDPAPLINQYRFNQQRSSNHFFNLPDIAAFIVLTKKIL